MFLFLVSVAVLGQCQGVINDLNETEYERMPPLFDLDPYESCMLQQHGRYCLLDLELSSDRPSDLMDLIRNFSANTIKHYNHSRLYRGICVYKTCQKYLPSVPINGTEEALAAPLEACMNASLWRDYELQAKVLKVHDCLSPDDRTQVDAWDLTVAVIYVVLIVLNATGTYYDYRFCDIDSKSGNPYLLAFSMRRNWRKLIAPSGLGPDPRLNRLKLFNGMRTITMVCVFFSHTALVMTCAYLRNPYYIEKQYDDPFRQILFNGSLVTYTFFVMSAFLLAYNFLIHAEKHPTSLWLFPKGVLQRWLRLTPTYALVIATITSWMRHLGSGPMWSVLVTGEVDACRKYWWAHLLYINNYIYDDSHCIPQAWYLAADTQLFVVGLLLCVLARTPRTQKISLGVLFIISILIPGLQTYLQDLDPMVIQSPDKVRDIYKTDDTFRLLYIAGHTNLSTYTLGLAGGMLVYYWQREGRDFGRYKHKLRYGMWCLFPLGVATIMSGAIFFIDDMPMPRWVVVLYAATYKPVFQLIIVLFIIGCIFKIENVYRCIVEWRGFTWAGRASYAAFLLHPIFQRGRYGTTTQLVQLSEFSIFHFLFSTTFLSFTAGAVLWMTVESPISQVTRAILQPKRRHLDDNITNGVANIGLTPDGQTKL